MKAIPSACPNCGHPTDITWGCTDGCSYQWGHVGLTVQQVNNLPRERDALLAAALEAIPHFAEDHPVLAILKAATEGLRPTAPAERGGVA